MDSLFYKLQTDKFFLVQMMMMAGLGILVLLNLFLHFRLKKRLNAVTHKQDGISIEAVINQYYKDIEEVKVTDVQILKKQAEIEETLKHCITKIGVIRFNPFGEVGGNQSFAIALLDGDDSGIVISSLYGRESSRFYGKPIVHGKCTAYQLSTEEAEAVKRAKRGQISE